MINEKLRQVQIALITDESNDIIEWFNGIWDKLIVVKADIVNENGGEVIFYTHDEDGNHCIFYYDISRNLFLCNLKLYWKNVPISGYTPTAVLSKLLIDRQLNSDIPLPNYATFEFYPRIEKFLHYL